MKYMLMMHASRGDGIYGIQNWSPAEFQAHIAFMHAFNKDLIARGELLAAEGLAIPGEAKLVRADSIGAPITDGVFPESKEFLAGFWMVQTATTERALEIAATASTAPGPGGRPLNMNIEVRQVMSGPPPID
jgi:hypothetical protein